MKKFLIVLLALFLAVGSVSIAHARFDREQADEAGYVDALSTSTDTALIARPCYIYGITINPASAQGQVLVYDNSSTTQGTVKIEIGESAQFDTRRYVFDPPVQMNNGAYVDVTSASAIIEYR